MWVQVVVSNDIGKCSFMVENTLCCLVLTGWLQQIQNRCGNLSWGWFSYSSEKWNISDSLDLDWRRCNWWRKMCINVVWVINMDSTWYSSHHPLMLQLWIFLCKNAALLYILNFLQNISSATAKEIAVLSWCTRIEKKRKGKGKILNDDCSQWLGEEKTANWAKYCPLFACLLSHLHSHFIKFLMLRFFLYTINVVNLF